MTQRELGKLMLGISQVVCEQEKTDFSRQCNRMCKKEYQCLWSNL